MSITSRSKSLIVAGAVLFLLGLLQGGVIQAFLNPRMALSAHLTAVQSGMALMIVGLVWPHVRLSIRIEKATQFAIILSMYGLWMGLTASAATGASNTLPIAGTGHDAEAFVELIVSAIVLLSSGIMTIGWLSFVAGLLRSGRG